MHQQIVNNKRKTVILMLAFFALVGLLGLLLSTVYKSRGMLIGTGIFALLYSVWGFFASSSLALSINGAKQISSSDNPQLYKIIENLCITDGLPMPKIYVINDPCLNAFATGRDPQHASVAITTGLLDVLDKSEIQGVMAHELGHVKNYDIRVSMIAFALVGVVSLVSDMFLRMSFWGAMSDEDNNNSNSPFYIVAIIAMLLAPLVATFMQLALSRRREYLADITGAQTTKYPEGLARALEKIRDYGSTLQRQNTSTAHFFIANPIKGEKLSNWLSTHPPIERRIAILRGLNKY